MYFDGEQVIFTLDANVRSFTRKTAILSWAFRALHFFCIACAILAIIAGEPGFSAPMESSGKYPEPTDTY